MNATDTTQLTTANSAQTLALTNEWINAATVNGIGVNLQTIGYCEPTWTQSCYPWTYWVTPSQSRPVKLTLSEIDKLRKAAKQDKAVGDILAKFTGVIEIVVDFK